MSEREVRVGTALALVGTVLVPENALAQQRKLLSYNTADDALTPVWAPSCEFLKGAALEQALIQSALKEGMVVMSPDDEGLQSLWTVGVNSGVLDGIRAAERFAPAGLDGVNTPVAVTGYSGGVPVDLGNVARKVDGKSFAGVYFSATTALARGHPEIDVQTLTNDKGKGKGKGKGKAMMAKAADMCLGQFLAGAPNPLTAFAFQK